MDIRHRILAAGLVLAAVLSPVAAGAGTVTWNFYGHVTDNSAVPAAPVGTPLFLSISYPLDVSNESSDPGFIEYVHDGGTAGFGTTVKTTAIRYPTIIHRLYELRTGLEFFAEAPEVLDGYLMSFIGVHLLNLAGPTGISEELPLAFDLAAFDVREFWVELADAGGPAGTVFGLIDRIEVTIADIPAPGLTVLFGFGALYLGRYARRISPG